MTLYWETIKGINPISIKIKVDLLIKREKNAKGGKKLNNMEFNRPNKFEIQSFHLIFLVLIWERGIELTAS